MASRIMFTHKYGQIYLFFLYIAILTFITELIIHNFLNQNHQILNDVIYQVIFLLIQLIILMFLSLEFHIKLLVTKQSIWSNIYNILDLFIIIGCIYSFISYFINGFLMNDTVKSYCIFFIRYFFDMARLLVLFKHLNNVIKYLKPVKHV